MTAGLIPAHAGKTDQLQRRRGLRMGSSPLTRGKLPTRRCHRLVGGLIPAHVGKTQGPSGRNARARAHPRSCGENIASAATRGLDSGSSPLTRGKPSPFPPLLRHGRLIPAHAGKTVATPVRPIRPTAHPRSCGENDPSAWTNYLNPGSSPLKRGKRGVLLRALSGPGLIPADAGKT